MTVTVEQIAHLLTEAGGDPHAVAEAICDRQMGDGVLGEAELELAFFTYEQRAQALRTVIEERTVRCSSCKRERPSAEALTGRLAFYEYRGPGSREALKSCKHCRYYDVAHDKPKDERSSFVCDHFEADPAGREVDLYYCGCKGWD